MTAVLTKNLWNTMPGWGIVANLLPPELLEARRASAVRRFVALGAVAVVLLALLGYGYETWRAHSASDDLTHAQDTTNSLTAEQGKFREVVQIQGTLAQIQAQTTTLMAGDVQFANVRTVLRTDLLPGMTISQIAASVDTGSGTAGSSGASTNSGSALNTSSAKAIGAISLTGTALHFSDVSAYVDRLGQVAGLASVYPISNAANTGGVQFNLQISINDLSLSHQYEPKPVGEQVMSSPRMSLGSSARLAKAWTYGGVAGCLLLAIIAWFAFVSPAMSHVSSVKSQTADANAQNDTLRAKINHLKEVDAGIADLRTKLGQARVALPVTDALPDFTRQLQTEAAAAQVALVSINAGAPTVVGTSGATTPAPIGVSTNAAGKLYEIPVTLVTAGDLAHQLVVLKAVQTMGLRDALVGSVNLTPGSSATTTSIDHNVTMTVQVQIFVAPQTPAAEAQLKQQLGAAATK